MVSFYGLKLLVAIQVTCEIETGHLTGIAEMFLDLKVASGGKLLPGEARPNQGIASLATHRHRRQLLLAEEIRLKQVLFSAFQVLLKKFFFFFSFLIFL